MQDNDLITIDVHFQGVPEAIAVYVIPHTEGVVLVESGPASTLPALEAGLEEHGFTLEDVTDVLLTHIHLDHAGAAGWIARAGAHVHVHPRGGPHLIDPQRLLESAGRIYGDDMHRLWGETIPISAEQVHVLDDGDLFRRGDLEIQAIDTPGHASHHHAYLWEGICFTGDVGGIRFPGYPLVEVPLPPPELQVDVWVESVRRLRGYSIRALAPTHFGAHEEVEWQFDEVVARLQALITWLDRTMEGDPLSRELFQERFIEWAHSRVRSEAKDRDLHARVEVVNPAWMSAQGVYRYWRKHHSAG